LDTERILHFSYMLAELAFLKLFSITAMHGSIELVALVVFSYLSSLALQRKVSMCSIEGAWTWQKSYV
jgi:hypothetical protein